MVTLKKEIPKAASDFNAFNKSKFQLNYNTLELGLKEG